MEKFNLLDFFKKYEGKHRILHYVDGGCARGTITISKIEFIKEVLCVEIKYWDIKFCHTDVFRFIDGRTIIKCILRVHYFPPIEIKLFKHPKAIIIS
jgi:hypothetical protein